ncbi:FAD binding domain-containing protein [bacterium]|nr:FAD binding domain-containing protein [bacterium]
MTAYHRPADLKEALGLLAEDGAARRPVGGGVSIIQTKDAKGFEGVDLGRLGLDKIEETPAGLRIGAMVTFGQMHRDDRVKKAWGGLLEKALLGAASCNVRNLISVGGNVVQCYYWSTLPPILLALDGTVRVENASGGRDIPAAEFFAQHPVKTLNKGDLVTHVTIPMPKTGERAAFHKYAEVQTEYALIQACVKLTMDGAKCSEARVAVGALSVVPFRSEAAEKILAGAELSDEVLAKAGAAAVEGVTVREDFRASRDYRSKVAPVIVRRTLAEALAVDSSGNGKGA